VEDFSGTIVYIIVEPSLNICSVSVS